jgi:hypothetical protein
MLVAFELTGEPTFTSYIHKYPGLDNSLIGSSSRGLSCGKCPTSNCNEDEEFASHGIFADMCPLIMV